MIDGLATDAVNLPAGYVLSNRYEIKRCLGRGGMGSVYLAHDRLLGWNPVAVKVLHRELARNERILKRFLREVQVMHIVNHPSVVRTYDLGMENEIVYFTMEYVPGVALSECGYEGTIGFSQLVRLAMEICYGLEAIHHAKIVHRDLKPGNIMLIDEEHVKITDFGMARTVSSEITQHKQIVGSVHYMAPEILQGHEINQTVDFYSLGVILFELVTGKLPFDAENPVGLMWMHIHKEPVAPILLQPDTPEWLNDLILNMLAKTAAGRPPTADHIVTYLRKHFDPRTIKPGSNRKSLADAAQSFAEQRNAKVPELPISEILGEEWDESARDSVELERSSVQAAARETTWDVPAPESCVEQAGYPPAAHAKSGRQQIDEGTVVLEWRRLYRSVVVVFTVVLLTVAALVFHIIETRVAGRQGLKVIRDLPRIIKRTGPESVPHVGIDSFTALFTDNNTHADSRRIVLRDDFPMLAAVLAASAANRKAGSKDKASLPETNAKVYAALDKSYLDTLNSLAGAGSELRFSSAEIGEAMDRGRLMNLSPIEQFRKDYGALSSIAETAAKSASASPAAPAGIDRHRDVTGVLAQETAAREQLKLIEHELSILRLADDAAVAAERNRIMDRQQQISSARQQLFAALDVARKLYHVWLFRADLAQKTGSGSPELQRGLHTARSNLVQTVLLIAALQQEDAHNGQVLKFIEQRSEMPQNEQQIKSSQLSAIKGDVEIKLSSLAQELPAEQSAFLRFLQAFEAAAYL